MEVDSLYKTLQKLSFHWTKIQLFYYLPYRLDVRR